MLNKVARYVAEHHLLKPDGHYLIALSGGADSVGMLLIAKELGWNVEAIHCNFKLRGTESDRDEKFCQQLCRKYDVPLHLVHFDTRSYAALHKQSIEMAARELRYNYFEQLSHDLEMDGIFVAHHQDDSVETLLMNLVRGTGVNGLRGIRPVQRWGTLTVIRPLLSVNRHEIEDFLHQRGQDFVTDSSNMVPDVVRNKIRLQVIPLLKTINPAAVDNMAKTAERVDEAAHVYEEVMLSEVERIRQPLAGGVFSAPIAAINCESVLYYLLKDYGFAPAQVEQIYARLHGSSVGTTYSAGNYTLVVDRTHILLGETAENDFSPKRIPEEGNYVFGDDLKLKISRFHRTADFSPSKDADVATLDDETVAFPLTLRAVREGDRFHPFGMKGCKLVSDYLTDRKRSLLEKRRQLVVEDAEGKLVWLVGERTDNRCRITENTQQILLLQISR